jgi:hypothetical protein
LNDIVRPHGRATTERDAATTQRIRVADAADDDGDSSTADGP